MRTFLLHAASLLAVTAATLLHAQTPSEIDPMLGADKGGNVFVGPTLPFGMAKPGPDYGNNQGNSGWRATGNLNGFSQLHVSGTGGGPKYGNILVQPQAGKADPAHASAPREDEHAEVGYYSVKLGSSGIRAEVTTARRTPVYRFTWPANGERTLLVDVGHLPRSHKAKRPKRSSGLRLRRHTQSRRRRMEQGTLHHQDHRRHA